MQTVAETSIFIRQAEQLFSADEKAQVIDLLATSPRLGDEIPGTGGVRKLRVAARGRGKSGGARIIYYFYDEDAPIYALLAYGKGRKTDLTPDDTKAVAEFARRIKAAQRGKRQ